MMTDKTFMRIIAAVSAVLLTGTAALTVYAYLGAKPEKKVNTIQIGENAAEVTEIFTEPETQTGTDTFTKTVAVKNTGSVGCFVRVYLELSDSRLQDGKVSLSADGNQFYPAAEFSSHLPENWVYLSEKGNALDGYYYYQKALAPDAETDALLTAVKTDFGNIYDISDFEIIVYSETVQTVEIDAEGTVYADADWRKAWESFLRVPASGTPDP